MNFMRNITIAAIASFAILQTANANSIEKDFSISFTNGSIKPEKIHIVSSEDANISFGNFKIATGFVEGYRKPFAILYNKDYIFLGNLIKRTKNKKILLSKIQENFQKIKKEQERYKKIADKRTIKELEKNYKDIFLTLQGKGKKGTIYIGTDANCPFCIEQFRNGELRQKIQEYKNIVIIPVFLRLPGHENSLTKAVWLENQWQKSKTNSEKFKLLEKFFDRNFHPKSSKETKVGNQISKLMKSGLIDHTPTILIK